MERIMQYVWQHKLFIAHNLVTTSGKAVQVVEVGVPSGGSGVEFFNAKVRIGGALWVGNVAIHRRSSQWMEHRHHTEKGYDNVVLHVVECADCEVLRTTGEAIEQLVLRCSPTLYHDYEELLLHSDTLSCCGRLTAEDGLLVSSWISSLAMERLQLKTERVMEWLDRSKGDWQEVCYLTLARNLGFNTNSDAFERLARSLPLAFLHKHADSLFQVEAMLYGQAGLLSEVLEGDDPYYKQLATEYRFLQHKFGLQPIDVAAWHFSRLRPANFPHKRIALLAQLLQGGFQLFTAICEAQSEVELRGLFLKPLTGYWCDHYLFGHPSPSHTRCLSNSAIDIILINTVAPLLYAYGIKSHEDSYCDRAMELLEQIKPENNAIVRHFGAAGIEATNALESQALIQLKRNYCEGRRCLFCRIGHKLLAKAAVGR